jgi:hypothetical protein
VKLVAVRLLTLTSAVVNMRLALVLSVNMKVSNTQLVLSQPPTSVNHVSVNKTVPLNVLTNEKNQSVPLKLLATNSANEKNSFTLLNVVPLTNAFHSIAQLTPNVKPFSVLHWYQLVKLVKSHNLPVTGYTLLLTKLKLWTAAWNTNVYVMLVQSPLLQSVLVSVVN